MVDLSTTEVIHVLAHLTKKYMEINMDLDMGFIDLEKAYDIVPQERI